MASDSSPPAPTPPLAADLERALLAGLADDPPPPARGADPPPADKDEVAAAPAAPPAAAPAPLDDLERALVAGLAEDARAPPRGWEAPAFEDGPEVGPARAALPAPAAAARERTPAAGLAEDAPAPPRGWESPAFESVAEVAAAPAAAPTAPPAPPAAAGTLGEPPAEPAAPPPDEDEPAAADLEAALVAAPSDRPLAALAFARDAATEGALRDGLAELATPPPGHEEPQVWPGDLGTAVAMLAEGHRTPLLLVDIDGIPYPAGALHELAAVCEVGTVVIAIGANGTAQASREILLAGVSDYLVKPVTAAAVREAVARAQAPAAETLPGGSVAGFVGVGGSGATTLAAATALEAAARGRYVSVVDLDRTVSALALMLDVEPASGLEHLLEGAQETPPDPEMVEDVRAERSDRIAVYAYRWAPAPLPLARPAAVSRLLAHLRRRSQLVVVDGVDDPALLLAVLAEVDARVLVAEPTPRDVARAERLSGLLGDAPPLLRVENRTRALARGRRARRGRAAERAPDVAFPFVPRLPGIADRGWPQDWLPRPLRKPAAALADRILSSQRAAAGVAAAPPERR